MLRDVRLAMRVEKLYYTITTIASHFHFWNLYVRRARTGSVNDAVSFALDAMTSLGETSLNGRV